MISVADIAPSTRCVSLSETVTSSAALYYTISEQIRLYFDSAVIFYPANKLDGSLTKTEEYPFCFVFALFLRTLRELGGFDHIEVWCEQHQEQMCIRYLAKNGAPAQYFTRLGRMYNVFSPMAKEAGLICRTAKRTRAVSVMLHLALYEGVDFTLSAISSEAISAALADAYAFDLTQYL